MRIPWSLCSAFHLKVLCSAPEVVAVCVLLYPIDSYLSKIAVSTIVFEIKISFLTLESVEVDKTCDNRDHMRYATRAFSLYGGSTMEPDDTAANHQAKTNDDDGESPILAHLTKR